jgi:Domain of unknown function (DUF4158)
VRHYRQAVHSLDDLACQTGKGIVLAAALVQDLRNRLILLPSLDVIERIALKRLHAGTAVSTARSMNGCRPQHRSAFQQRRERASHQCQAWTPGQRT